MSAAAARVIATALVVLGGFAVATAPDSAVITKTFDVPALIGESTQSRWGSVDVASVSLSPELVLDDPAGFPPSTERRESAGLWVVIDVTVTSRQDSVSLGGSRLEVGELQFSSVETITPSLASFSVGPGVPVSGTVVFEIPADALEADSARMAIVRLAPSVFTRALDDEFVTIVDLRSAPMRDSITVAPAEIIGVSP